MNLPERPITILIAALGGEGGGVMADWLMEAATSADLPAQATSIPGVAQRTGATTYYLEIFPLERKNLHGREPVLSLTPSPGNVDIMVASELVEAGRAMSNGYVSPERTTLIASTHRIYATIEKELRSQYLIAYQSTNTGGGSDFRTVDLKVNKSGLEAKTMRGYYP